MRIGVIGCNDKVACVSQCLHQEFRLRVASGEAVREKHDGVSVRRWRGSGLPDGDVTAVEVDMGFGQGGQRQCGQADQEYVKSLHYFYEREAGLLRFVV